jgi:hypothetical protein
MLIPDPALQAGSPGGMPQSTRQTMPGIKKQII